MSNKFNLWLKDEISLTKKNKLHRVLTQIDSGMSPEIMIGGKKYIQFIK